MRGFSQNTSSTVLYYKTRIRLSGSRDRTKSGSSVHFKLTLPKNQDCLEMEWAVSRGSELLVTGGVQDTVQPGL